MDIAVDTEKLEIFGTIITEVKMEGRVPASSHLVYDCSHGEWLLAQMAYDRKIRLFSSRYETARDFVKWGVSQWGVSHLQAVLFIASGVAVMYTFVAIHAGSQYSSTAFFRLRVCN